MSTLREAARALLQALDRHGWTLAAPQQRKDLQAALDAPPPGLEEVREKLWELWVHGLAAGPMGRPNMRALYALRDRLIAELLAMWPRAIPEPRGCPTPGACSCGGTPPEPRRDEDDLR